MTPYYKTELGTLYCGDCLEVMNDLIENGIKVDAIITDVPYQITNCDWDKIIPFEPMWDKLKKLRNDNTPIVLFGSEPFSSALRMSNIKEYKYDWYWDKQNSGNILCAKYMPMKVIENVLVFGKSKIKYNPQKIKRTEEEIKKTLAKRSKKIRIKESEMFSNIKSGGFIDTANVEFKNPQNILNINAREKECNNVNRVHNTQKPLELIKYLIKTYSNEGDLILDFTSGSGTLAVAAEQLNRRWICIEQEEKCCEITKERLKKRIMNL